jgi:hypothetical protein
MTELDLTPVLVIGIIFGGWALIIHVIQSSRIKKKMLEVGKVDIDPELMKTMLGQNESSISSLKWGIVGLFSGLGLLIINLISDLDAPALFFGIEIISASLGFITYFLLYRKYK